MNRNQRRKHKVMNDEKVIALKVSEAEELIKAKTTDTLIAQSELLVKATLELVIKSTIVSMSRVISDDQFIKDFDEYLRAQLDEVVSSDNARLMMTTEYDNLYK